MGIESKRLVLCQDTNGVYPGIDAIAKGKVNNRILSDMISCFIRDICGGQKIVTGGSRILPVIFYIK